VLLLVACLIGCSPLQHVVQVSSEVIAAAEPCLVAQYKAAQEQCLTDPDVTKAEACVKAVRATFAPIAQALGELRDTRCPLEPAKCEGALR
jgi:hypothetical protein